MLRILPGEKIPANMFETLDGHDWPGAEFTAPRFRLLVVYRGVQCSYCRKQLIELNAKMPALAERNVSVIAVSADSKARAQQAVDEWRLDRLRLGFNLSIEAARRMGLYISAASREAEMPYFSEPGLFLIAPDQTLFASWISSYPFARPHLDEIVEGIDFILENKRPPRGNN